MTTEATLASFVETVDTDVDTHPLDDPVRQGLRGHHAQFARWAGRVARYDPTVAPFVGHPPELDMAGDVQDRWQSQARLACQNGFQAFAGEMLQDQGQAHTVIEQSDRLDDLGNIQ